MKTTIRKGVFETNSSSTHAICIDKESAQEYPVTLSLYMDHFGWDFRSLSSPSEKASYLYTAATSLDEWLTNENLAERVKSAIWNRCIAHNVDINVARIPSDDYWYTVDHALQLEEFVNAMLRSEKTLDAYLFSLGSYVFMGNDNSEKKLGDKEWADIHPHGTIYYKGN